MRFVKYIGSKRKLIPHIVEAIKPFAEMHPDLPIVDLFCGSGRVSWGLRESFTNPIISNDVSPAAVTTAQAYTKPSITLPKVKVSVTENHWFVQNYAHKARFYTIGNALKIASAREMCSEPEQLASLLVSADAVDSTVGVQAAYLKKYATRAERSFELVPFAEPVELKRRRSLEGYARLGTAESFINPPKAACVYIDPPYTQHSYSSYYHLNDTIVLWDNPIVSGVPARRTDHKSRKSLWNSAKTLANTFDQTLQNFNRSHGVVVSYSVDGLVPVSVLCSVLNNHGFNPEIKSIDHKMYVGTDIGGRHGTRAKEARDTTTEFLIVGHR